MKKYSFDRTNDSTSTTLGEIAEIVMGQSPKGETYNKEGIGVPLINGPTEFGQRYPNVIQWTTEPTKYCYPNDLLLCVRGSSTGRINIANERYCIGRGVAAIRPENENIDMLYLNYLVERKVSKMVSLSTGSTFPNISSADIRAFDVNLPSITVQKKTGNFVYRLDLKIQKQQEKIELLKVQKTGLMQKIFSQVLRLKDENGQEYPKWDIYKLSDFVERVVRKNKELTTKRPLTISAQFGLVDQIEFFNKKVASANLEGYYLLKHGEFAYNKSYSNGYPWGAIKRLDKYEHGALSTLYICFSTTNNTHSDFLVHYFDSNEWHKEVSLICVEGARNHGLLNVSVTEFFETSHRLPCLEEQKRISDFLDSLNKNIQQNEEKLVTLVNQKKGIMQQMFL